MLYGRQCLIVVHIFLIILAHAFVPWIFDLDFHFMRNCVHLMDFDMSRQIPRLIRIFDEHTEHYGDFVPLLDVDVSPNYDNVNVRVKG